MRRVYVGLDVSDEATHVCVLDDEGEMVSRGVCAIYPEALAQTLELCGRFFTMG